MFFSTVAGRHLVWLDKNSFEPLRTDDGDLDIWDFKLEENTSFIMQVNPTLQLFSWGGAIGFPEIHLLVNYQARVHENVVFPWFTITMCYFAPSNTEWLLSFVLPISDWRQMLMDSFRVELGLFGDHCLENRSGVSFSAQICTPRFPPALKALMSIWSQDSLLEEGMLLAYNSATAATRDFLHLSK